MTVKKDNLKPKTLFDVAFACFLFGHVVDFDTSWLAFCRFVKGCPDIDRPEHRQALLTWLNQWGCRQFAKAHHEEASRVLLAWYEEYEGKLPPSETRGNELTDANIQQAAEAYGVLSAQVASWRSGAGGVTFGPVGAAKTLFALRPRSLPPWDTPIRDALALDRSAESYGQYVAYVREIILDLATQCRRHGFGIEDLPARIGREEMTLPKLIDEYFWITITRKCCIPGVTSLTEWLAWI